MSVADVQQAVLEVMEVAGEFADWFADRKADTRYAMVDPILWALGWRTWLPWECRLDFQLGNRGRVDYALLDPDGDIAVLVAARELRGRRSLDRQRLAQLSRGWTDGVAVLTYGSRWEIYDLGHRTLRFTDKCVANLVLDPETQDGAERCVQALHQWLRKDFWWER